MPSFTVDVTTDDHGSSVVLPVGELDIATAPKLEAVIGRLLDEGARSVAVDASQLAFVDSTGLGALVNAHKRVLAASGSFLVRGANDRLRSIAKMTRLDEILVFVDD